MPRTGTGHAEHVLRHLRVQFLNADAMGEMSVGFVAPRVEMNLPIRRHVFKARFEDSVYWDDCVYTS